MAGNGGSGAPPKEKVQALQAPVNSHSAAPTSSEERPTSMTKQVHDISDKLGELIESGEPDGLSRWPNQRRELVNEDGLPVVDINEPLPEDSQEHSEPVFIDDTLQPLASLPSERARWQIERDRILDLLEQEEEIEQRRNEEQELVQKREALQKRKDAVKAEVENLKAAREMQKRMGKALLKNMAEAREREDDAQRAILAQDTGKRKMVKQSKSVSFADLPDHHEASVDRTRIREKEVRLDGGDVALARLKAGGRFIRNPMAENLPMKMDVVERVSGLPPDGTRFTAEDSDDESPTASPDLTDDHGIELDDSSDLDDDSDGNPELEEEEYDLDAAGHQREIALEYYKKRDTVRKEVATAMTSQTLTEDDWNQAEVPLDATLSAPHPKPPMSRFKASRLASSSTSPPPSTSLGSYIIPASASGTIQRAIRTGKLEGGRLVDGNASDDDDNVKEVLELLRKGEVRNIGPKLNIHPNDPPSTIQLEPHVPVVTSSKRGNSKTARTPDAQVPSPGPSITRTDNVQSSSPKTSSDTASPAGNRCRPAFVNGSKIDTESGPRPLSSQKSAEPPIFSPPSESPPAAIINSPSFAVQQDVVISPSFPPHSSRPLRPPAIMSAVSERRAGVVETNQVGVAKPAKKVSRFMENRG